MDKLKVVELFAGVGTQAQALKNIGLDMEVIATSDIDKYANETYIQIHGPVTQLNDICKIEKLPKADLWTYSFPCFTGDTLVLTDKGYKEIRNIKVGDKVLTHQNRFKEVVNFFDNGIHQIMKVKCLGVDEIKCTLNHKFFVKENGDEPKWVEAKDLHKGHFMSVAINQNSIIPTWDGIDFVWSDGRKTRHSNKLSSLMDNESFWWLIGRYIGDGWVRTQGGIIICCAKDELSEITDILEDLPFNYDVVEERTVYKIHIPMKELSKFVEQFGMGAGNKHLTNTVLDLPTNLLYYFLEGYLSADGCIVNDEIKCTTISRDLVYGLGQCIAKTFHTPYKIYKNEVEPTYMIENRIVNQQNWYQLVFHLPKQTDQAYYENGYIWVPFRGSELLDKQNVYDIEVEEDHSFTVQNIIAHNCQDISIAGLRRGLIKGKTRSGLLFEVGRLLEVSADNNELPKYLLMENVKNLVGEKFKPVFDQWVSFLEEFGYKSYWKVLNARNYGIPQNRERIFCVSILGDHEPFVFPEPQKLTLKLKDMLEENVDSKYYLSDKIQERFVFRKQGSNVIGTTAPDRKIGQRDVVYDTDGVMGALTATDYKQPKQIIEFEMPNGKKAEFDDTIEEPTVFKEVRTELGKQMRKEARLAGKGDTTPRNKDCKKFVPQNNGIANCLTTTIGSEQIVLIPGTIIFTPNGDGYTKHIIEGDLQIDNTNTHNEEVLEETSTSKYPMTRTEYKEGHLQIVGDIMQAHESSGRCYREEGISPTLTTGCGTVVKLFEGTEKSYKIRKLTPRECWRLMGWTDEQFDRIHGMSDGQLYKMAGNAIVIQVLEAIFKELFKDRLVKPLDNQ